MNRIKQVLFLISLVLPALPGEGATENSLAAFRLRFEIQQLASQPDSNVKNFSLHLPSRLKPESGVPQWMLLEATKANGETYRIYLLARAYPQSSRREAEKTIDRYILQEGSSQPIEFRNHFTEEAVLPSLGGWEHLFPRDSEGEFDVETVPQQVEFLGFTYHLVEGPVEEGPIQVPETHLLRLTPDLLVGLPGLSRQKDETRRYDESDYELIPLIREDYQRMIDSGMTCIRVDAAQAEWIRNEEVFHWGIGGKEVSYPECLYRSNYLGPALYLDEPAVSTRDHVLRSRFAEEPQFRKEINPQIAFQEFQKFFQEKNRQGSPTALIQSLQAREDVDVGKMDFLQTNIYSWETMIATAGHQLSEFPEGPPSVMVFEPPGRFGTRRTLPEMNMAYGCQIPTDNPKNLASIIYGFLRGAARATGKGWGMSVYGAVDRADTYWFQTHAYDLGATHFFFWDSYQLACVPFGECLAMSRHLRAHAESHPDRDLEKLRQTAQELILIPPGYNLGHVHMGRGNLWGLGELNLDRLNNQGVPYRTVMGNLFTEIERCLRLGITFDLLWDLPGLPRKDYESIVRIREDGKVEVEFKGETILKDRPETPPRPSGHPPELAVELSVEEGVAPLTVTAIGAVTEGSSPVYYTLGADSGGIYQNALICWELFGPEEEDYRFLMNARDLPKIEDDKVEISFDIDRPGSYRLRAATVDLQGRTSVVEKAITVKE